MDKPVKSGREILDDFFNTILDIPSVDKKLASEIKGLYENNELTYINLTNRLASLREGEMNAKN